MECINQAIVSGCLAKDAEISSGKSGQKYGHFLLEQTFSAGGRKRKRFFPCFTSEDQIRKMMEAGKGTRGSYVTVNGIMDPSKYTDSQGNTKQSFSLKLCSVYFEGPRLEDSTEPSGDSEKSFAQFRREKEDADAGGSNDSDASACDDDYFED